MEGQRQQEHNHCEPQKSTIMHNDGQQYLLLCTILTYLQQCVIIFAHIEVKKNPNYLSHLKMVSAFVDMEDAEPHFSSSAASQKAKFSPGKHTQQIQISNCYTSTFLGMFTSISIFKCTTYSYSAFLVMLINQPFTLQMCIHTTPGAIWG